MANYDLLNQTCYLEDLLTQMSQQMNRLAQLGNTIQQEEAYYASYPISMNFFQLPGHKWSRLFFTTTMTLCAATGYGIAIAIPLFLVRRYYKNLEHGGIINWIRKFSLSFVYGFIYLLALSSGISGLLFVFNLPILFLASLVAAYFLTIFLTIREIKQLNDEIEEENAEIEERNLQRRNKNQSILAKCDSVSAEIKGLQQQITETVNQIHYPPDYVCLEAVRFFIHGLRNDRADDYRRLIDLFEEHNYRQRMLDGQQELLELSKQQTYNQERMVQLLNFANGLNAANLAAQLRTQAEVRSLHETVYTAYYHKPLY